MNLQSTPAVRESIIFPLALYETFAKIAKQGKVSLAWGAPHAAKKYVADRTVPAREQTQKA